MKQETQNDQLIEKYLLGDLPESVWEEIERRYFTDPDFLERMEAIEEELIESYSSGALSGEKRSKVEQNLLNSPYQQEKAKFAGLLLRSIDEVAAANPISPSPAQPRESWWAPALRALRYRIPLAWSIPLVAALMLVCGWLVVERNRLRQELEKSHQELAELRRREQNQKDAVAEQQKLTDPKQDPPQKVDEEKRGNTREETRPRPPATQVASLLLLPRERVAGGPINELTISAGIKFVQLQLVYGEEDYPRYSALLETGDRDRVLDERTGLRAVNFGKEKRINYVIPTSKLDNRTYHVRLRGVRTSAPPQVVGVYSFKINRK